MPEYRLLLPFLMPQEGKVDLSGLYPGFDAEELQQVEDWFREYLGVVFPISERQAKDVPNDPPPEVVAEPIAVR